MITKKQKMICENLPGRQSGPPPGGQVCYFICANLRETTAGNHFIPTDSKEKLMATLALVRWNFLKIDYSIPKGSHIYSKE